MRTINGNKVPIGENRPSNSGDIEFYDVGKREKVKIPSSQVKSKKLPSGKYQFSAPAPSPNKAGKPYTLYKFSSNPP